MEILQHGSENSVNIFVDYIWNTHWVVVLCRRGEGQGLEL